MTSGLEGTARYTGLLLNPVEGFSQGFFAPWAQKELFMDFVPILGHFWCSVVTYVTFSSNLKNIFKKSKKSPQKSKNKKNTKNLKESKKI